MKETAFQKYLKIQQRRAETEDEAERKKLDRDIERLREVMRPIICAETVPAYKAILSFMFLCGNTAEEIARMLGLEDAAAVYAMLDEHGEYRGIEYR